jgi:hypothetical protein
VFDPILDDEASSMTPAFKSSSHSEEKGQKHSSVHLIKLKADREILASIK